jgi:hypothetical protein
LLSPGLQFFHMRSLPGRQPTHERVQMASTAGTHLAGSRNSSTHWPQTNSLSPAPGRSRQLAASQHAGRVENRREYHRSCRTAAESEACEVGAQGAEQPCWKGRLTSEDDPAAARPARVRAAARRGAEHWAASGQPSGALGPRPAALGPGGKRWTGSGRPAAVRHGQGRWAAVELSAAPRVVLLLPHAPQ